MVILKIKLYLMVNLIFLNHLIFHSMILILNNYINMDNNLMLIIIYYILDNFKIINIMIKMVNYIIHFYMKILKIHILFTKVIYKLVKDKVMVFLIIVIQ